MTMTPAKRNQDWMPNIFNDFFGNECLDTFSHKVNPSVPAMNIIETDDEFKVELAAPGLKKEDFKVHVDNNELIISVEKKTETEDKKGKYLRREFGYTQFKQTLLLPDNVDKEHIEAKQDHGVLSINIKKKNKEEHPNTKPIEVK